MNIMSDKFVGRGSDEPAESETSTARSKQVVLSPVKAIWCPYAKAIRCSYAFYFVQESAMECLKHKNNQC